MTKEEHIRLNYPPHIYNFNLRLATSLDRELAAEHSADYEQAKKEEDWFI